MASWQFAYASAKGTSHSLTNTPCQDAGVCLTVTTTQRDEVLIALASDGAGSAQRAEVGSRLVCDSFLKHVTAFFENGFELGDITVELVTSWLGQIIAELTQVAASEGLAIREFACTFLAAIIGNERSLFLQVGDGGMVVASEEDPEVYCWIFWPAKGPYANTTFFLTDRQVFEHIQIDLIARSIKEIAVFTDGIENLALQFSSKEAFSPFFKGLFPSVRSATHSCEEVSHSLLAFLDSPRVNERTDDDKTLILATRRILPTDPV